MSFGSKVSATDAPPAEWHFGATLSVPDLCVHQLFDQQVRRDPDAVAVVSDGRQLSYRELDDRTTQMAHRLIELGVGRESLVVVCLPRSIELVIALLAILKAGGAYLPVDPDWPEARKGLVLDEVGPSAVVISNRMIAPRFREGARLVDPRDPDLANYSSETPDWTAHTTGQLAYVNFTSGSTGRPKGVMIEHRGIRRLLDPGAPWRMGPGDRILHLAPAAFDATTLEIWLPLLSGATVVLAPAGLQALDELATLIREQRISTLFLTAGLFHAMADSQLPTLAGVRTLMTGGEVLDPDLIQAVLDAMPAEYQLVAVYGPTESTTYATDFPIRGGSTLPDGEPVPLGRPLAATTAYILSPSGDECPVGEPGELCIGGQGLARGYLNNPELTAEKFVSVDISCENRLYRSGDLASWNPDGTIAFHGRIDQQVKVSGIRIEPGEIEAALREHPAVARAVVVLRRDNPRHPRLVAYWVPRNGDPVDANVLRGFLSERLPETMIPAAFVAIDSLPLSANGKVDRAALPAPQFGGRDRHLPRTGHESELVDVWAEVLGHNDFGIDDSFFTVGGNSLSAVRLQAHMKDRFACSFPLSTLFAEPTVRDQAVWLANAGNNKPVATGSTNLVTLQPDGGLTPLVVVHGWNGKLFNFLDLAKQLGTARPIWGLQTMTEGAAPLTDSAIRSMAAEYAEQIIERQPKRPIHLYSYSVGGWYAYAVAEALLERGASVGLVMVGDSEPDDARVEPRLRLSLLPYRVERKVSAFLRHPVRSARKIMRRLMGRSCPIPSAEPSGEDLAINQRDPEALMREQGLEPRPLDLSVRVFGLTGNVRLLHRTWRHYALGGVRCEALFDDHFDFVRPEFAPKLADALRRALDEFEASNGSWHGSE